MTVIAWDGKSIAADRLVQSSGVRISATKVKRLPSGVVAAWTGNHDVAMALIHWLEAGGKPEDWPKAQADKDRWTILIVVNEDRSLSMYEQEPYPESIEDKFMAWGSGRDFALAAMAMGATAREAVELTNRLCTTCGVGVDVIDL